MVGVVIVVNGYVTASEISEQSGVNENTVRRYIRNFPEFFPIEVVGRVRKFPTRCVEITSQIADMYARGMQMVEIKEVMATSVPAVVDVSPMTQEVLPRATMTDLVRVIEAQNEQIAAMAARMDGLEGYIKSRDKALVAEMRAVMEEKKKKVDWWKKILNKLTNVEK